MKGIFIIIAGFLWVLGLYWGYTTLLQKSAGSYAPVPNSRPADLQKEQRRLAQEALERQRDLMRQRQQDIRSHRDRF